MAISQNMERRLTSFMVIIVVIMSILVARLVYLQIIKGEHFFAKAEANRKKISIVDANRGMIKAASGETIVSNKMAYSALVKVTDLKEEAKVIEIVNLFTRILKVDRLEVLHTLTRSVIDNKIILKEKLTPEDKELINKNLEQLPGISIVPEIDVNGVIVKEDLEINVRVISTANLLLSTKGVSELLGLNYEDLLIKLIAKGGKSSSKDRIMVKIKRNLSQEEMVILEELKTDYPSISVEKTPIRDYVYGQTLAHVLGYVSAISLEELQNFKDKGYRGDDNIGKSGLEKYYEDYLRGQDGREEIEVNSRNQKVRSLGVNAPLPGSNLITNVDLGLQIKVEELLDQTILQLREMAKKDKKMLGGPTGGAIVVMNPNNGKILAMASWPTFNLNLFSAGMDSQTYRKLNSVEANQPFKNRAIAEAPSPGSIFKLVTSSAFLEERVVDEHTKVYDGDGRYMIGEWKYDNWARKTHGGYGWLNVVDAIAHSNNIYYYEIAHKLYKMGLGGVTIPKYAREFGLGKRTGIDLPEEVQGLVPDAEYKRKKYGQTWFPGETLHLSIGQGDLATTPIQLINYVSAIANGGKIYKPYVVDRIESYDGLLIKQFEPEVIGQLPVSKKNLDLVRKGMVGVATYGTAAGQLKRAPVVIAGKTGTAQTSLASANHGWFAGYAPADKPEIAILVFLQNGVSSSYTLPIVRDITQYYFVDRNLKTNINPEELVATDLVEVETLGTTNPDGTTQGNTTTSGTPTAPGATTPPLTKEEELANKLKNFYNEVLRTP